MTPQALVIALVLLPLVGAAIAGTFGRRIGDVPSMAITTGFLFISCALGWTVFAKEIFGGWPRFVAHIMPFIQVGDFKSDWSVRIDSLSAVMLVVVTTVSALVHLYSWGYMEDDDSKPRFFAYLSFFTFAMLALVTSADLMQLFFGWEGVGVASYWLIGFWFKKPTANAAAIKAFVVNRVGDFGFVLGIMTVFWMFHTIRFAEFFPLLATKANATWRFAAWNFSALDLAGFLLFIGAMGKSAQFFLHTWLPDAMEGPTPVSALIHAATMVTAGVYMVCLLSPIYELAPVAKSIIAFIGGLTALFAATIGLAQNDIKRVIAYSTCSQLGYMFAAAGAGAYQASMFHLFTHAFFKALLFLGAGSVIVAMHHEQDMRRMGGLWKRTPITYVVMLIGTLAITGVGIPGLDLGFAGFYSKDAIINSDFVAGRTNPIDAFAFVCALLAAGLTSFYSWRLVFMTFHGHAKWRHHGHGGAAHEHEMQASDHASSAQIETHTEPDVSHGHDDGHGHDEPHEPGWVMLIPLIALSVGAVFAGGVFAENFIGADRVQFWKGAIFTAEPNHVLDQVHGVPTWVALGPLVLTGIGFAAAWWAYIAKEGIGARIAARQGPLWRFLYNKWYFDEIYDFIFVKGAKLIGDLFWKGGDQKIIDGLGPNGVSAASYLTGRGVGRIQTGYVYHYAFVMLLGVAGLLAWALYAWS